MEGLGNIQLFVVDILNRMDGLTMNKFKFYGCLIVI